MAARAPFDRLSPFLDRIGDPGTPFALEAPDGRVRRIGRGEPRFHAALRSDRAVKALASLDEGNFTEAYLRGDIDLEGDMQSVVALRTALRDRHPLVAAWRFLQPLLFGQIYTNKVAIQAHYDLDPRLFLSFLDPALPAYSQGVYAADDEPLATALRRKFDYAADALELGPGSRVLEIGPGWGAFAGHALARGVDFVGLTISEVSKRFLERALDADRERVTIRLEDVLAYRPQERFDAIVIMGVIEHLPDYARVLRQFDALLKPGGFVFLDGSAARKKYELSTFMVRHIYAGNHSFLVLDDFLNKLARSAFELIELFNDRHSYYLTFRQWAENLERNADDVIREFGAFEYRKFRLYLWGATHEFASGNLECYRMILHKPRRAA